MLSLIGISHWKAKKYSWNKEKELYVLKILGTYKNSKKEVVEFQEVHLFDTHEIHQILFTKPKKKKVNANSFELKVNVALGTAYRAIRGYLAPEVKSSFEHAFDLTKDLETSPELFSVLYGLWSYYFVSVDYPAEFQLPEVAKPPYFGF